MKIKVYEEVEHDQLLLTLIFSCDDDKVELCTTNSTGTILTKLLVIDKDGITLLKQWASFNKLPTDAHSYIKIKYDYE